MMNQEEPIKKPKFIFPKKIAAKMQEVPQHVQMESSMIATTFLLFGLILIAVQQLFTGLSLILKLSIIFNIICGIVIMGSTLITSYQQYVHYVMTMGIDIKQLKKEARAKRKAEKAKAKAMKLAKQLQLAGVNIQSPQEINSNKPIPSFSNAPADNKKIEPTKKIEPIKDTDGTDFKQTATLIEDERRLIEEL